LTLKFTNLTLFWLINFLRLKLQNNSAFGVDVNSEANTFRMLQTFKESHYLTLAMIYLISTFRMLQTFKESHYLTLAMIYLISTLKATVESNQGTSQS